MQTTHATASRRYGNTARSASAQTRVIIIHTQSGLCTAQPELDRHRRRRRCSLAFGRPRTRRDMGWAGATAAEAAAAAAATAALSECKLCIQACTIVWRQQCAIDLCGRTALLRGRFSSSSFYCARQHVCGCARILDMYICYTLERHLQYNIMLLRCVHAR